MQSIGQVFNPKQLQQDPIQHESVARFDVVLAGTVSAHIPVSCDSSPDLFGFTTGQKSICHSENSHSHSRPAEPAIGLIAGERLFQSRLSVALQPDQIISLKDYSNPKEQIVCIKFGHKQLPLRIFVASKSILSVWTCDNQSGPTYTPSNLQFSSNNARISDMPIPDTPPLLNSMVGFQKIVRSDFSDTINGISVHQSDNFVAAHLHDSIMVVAVSTGAAVELQGHLARITACQFFNHTANPAAKDWLLSVSEDRTFKIWNYSSLECLYSSSIVCSSPLTCISFDLVKPIFAIGSEDSIIRFYDPTLHASSVSCEPRLVKSIDLDALCRKWYIHNTLPSITVPKKYTRSDGVPIVSSLPSWRRTVDQRNETIITGTAAAAEEDCIGLDSNSDVKHTLCILNMFYGPPIPSTTPHLPFTSRIFVACPSLIAVLDANSYGILHIVNFNSSQLNMELYKHSNNALDSMTDQLGLLNVKTDTTLRKTAAQTIQMARSISFSHCAGMRHCTFAAITHAMSGQITLLCIHEIHKQRLNLSLASNVSDMSLQDIVIGAIRKHVAGDKWVDNIYQDCMRELAFQGIHNLNQLSIRFGNDDSLVNNTLFLPMYVNKELSMSIKSNHIKERSFIKDTEFFLRLPRLGGMANDNCAHSTVKSASSTLKTGTKTSRSLKNKSSTNVIIDKPVTFRSTIKSSGYTQAPKATKLFSGLDASFSKPLKSKVSNSNLSSEASLFVGAKYPVNGNPLTEIKQLSIPTIPHTSSISCIRYHPSGRFLATGSADKCARFYRLTTTKSSGQSSSVSRDFHGHNSCVTDIAWRLNPIKDVGHVLLTSSLDGMVRLWGTDRSDPVLSISCLATVSTASALSVNVRKTSVLKTATLQLNQKSQPKKTGFSKPSMNTCSASGGSDSGTLTVWPIHARFFHRDQYLVTTAGSDIQFRTYTIQHADPAKFPSRISTKSILPPRPSTAEASHRQTRLVMRLESDAQTVTALACLNTNLSQYIVSATSDRWLHLWDAETSQPVLTWKDAHIRPVNCICLGETLEGVATGFEKLFVSTSIGDGIKIWDIRCESTGSSSIHPVLQFNGHVNRFTGVRCSVSPCGLYIATGSEDNHAYMYDIRMGRLVGKTRGNHGAVVTDVAFHPTIREMATACQDGRVKFFKD
ncbi:hypothetical protein BDEG_27300 [Batrachochytrium dendrobatidis JEL423]|uniref:Uncharacterized protein n=1 Tax=Batrachochytrium dendrobatidis (strain JEL423) TaxID=403673 RepID=A0A177WVA5_BATDL|nr:hypothetical protein BDEG_27300 [Batrachochytrium dendrobatidis JEL423]